jgi:hypothetical protein
VIAAVALSSAGDAVAQVAPGPPGPYVVDLRGATIGVPQFSGFYPPLVEGTLVPARAFGVEAGAHIYLTRLGPGHLGVGASVMQARATADAVSMTARVLAPQVSINFGTSEGWSYISGGVGVANLRGRVEAPQEPGRRSSGALMALNLGAGARWFFTRHVAIGFDLRLHRIGAGEADAFGVVTPATFLGSAAVGFSLK